jgi:hypothetical protein
VRGNCAIHLLKCLLEARRFTPDDPGVLFFLGHTYLGLGLYDDARAVLKEAFDCKPEGFVLGQLNRLMIDVLAASNAPVEEMVPYLKLVLRARIGGDLFPGWIKGRFKLLEKTSQHNNEWYAWAERILLDYETRHI